MFGIKTLFWRAHNFLLFWRAHIFLGPSFCTFYAILYKFKGILPKIYISKPKYNCMERYVKQKLLKKSFRHEYGTSQR